MNKADDAARTPNKVRWTHTDVEAPYLLDAQGFNQLETGRGIAYSAELVHPTLGVVGRIANTGVGGDTEFYPYDYDRFSVRDLEAFAAQCTQDEEPLESHFDGVSRLLDAVINEADFAEHVATMRKDGLFLVRSFEPRTENNHGPWRGLTSFSYRSIMLSPKQRQRIVQDLAERPEYRLADGAYWQMFNGRNWVPLPSEERFTADQITARIEALAALRGTSNAPAQVVPEPQGPIDDLYAYSRLRSDAFTLVEDTVAIVQADRWCQCTTRRPRLVRFEKWSLKDGPRGSGAIHAARSCRRLMTFD